MDWNDILARIREGENASTELKRGADTRPVGKALSAFANTEGGVLILGVDDDLHIVGVSENPETVAERLTGFLQTGLSAAVMARLGRVQHEGRWIHWIEVPRQRGYEPLKYEGRVYVRRARSSVEPSPSELQDLYNTYGYIVTEEQAVSGTSASHLEPHTFRRFMERLGIDLDSEPVVPTEDDLRNRGALTERDGAMVATLYGLLAFGRDPQGHAQTRSLWVECVAYGGLDRADPVLQVSEARGRLDEQIDRAMGWMKSIGRQERYQGIQRQDLLPVPEAALREALVNAVCHRDYAIMGSRILLEVFDDRVVVTSPGTLPNHMDPRSVMAGGHPRSRNELLATFMQTMRYMEGRGRGWPRIRREMRAHNGTEPELHEERGARWVRVTLRITGQSAL